MNSPSNPSSSSNSGDPWEELAEDLFGLEYGKEHGAREPSPAAETPAPPTRPVEPVAKADLESETESQAEPPAFASPEPDFAEPEIAESEYVQSTESDPAPAPATDTGSAQDSYWDALANWNWDDSEGSSSKSRSDAPRSSGGPPGRGGSRGRDDRRERKADDRPQRQSGSPSPPAPRPAAPPAGDDFGLGLEGESNADFSAPAEPPVVERHERTAPREQAPSTGSAPPRSDAATDRSGGRSGGGERSPDKDKAEGEFPRKRRRRRRRRSRGGERETPGTPAPASEVPGDDWDDSAGPEADLPDDESAPAAEESREESREEPAPPAGGDRPHGRSRGRNRGGRRHEEGRRSPAPEQAENRLDGDSDADAEEPEEEIQLAGGEVVDMDDGDDDSGEQLVNFEDVPTWEEAISYLLHPSTVQVEGGSSSGSSPPRTTPPATDQPRQTRHVGHRKHRR